MRLLCACLCVAALAAAAADAARLRAPRALSDRLLGAPRANDSCLCTPFYNCEDGTMTSDGAGLIDVRFGPRNKCTDFNICCDDVDKIKKIESKPGLDKSVMTTISDGINELFGVGTPKPLPGAAACVCVAFYLCDGGSLAPETAHQVDARQVSSTGRCSSDNEQCCALPKPLSTGGSGGSAAGGVVVPTPPACSCTGRQYCNQADVQPLRLGQKPCRPDEVCCSSPQTSGAVPVPDVQGPDYDLFKFCKSYPLSVACVRSRQINAQPTLRPVARFDPDADARRIYSSFSIGYLNADDAVLIDVLTKRTFEQRGLIAQAYNRIYGRDLKSDITRATRGNFEDLMQRLVKSGSYYDFLAEELHDSMHRLGTDEDTVLETLISSTNDEIKILERHYYQLDGEHSLIDDIKGDFSGDLEDILVALVNGSRDNSFRVSRQHAEEQAQGLYHAGEHRLGTEEQTFKYYLTHENYAQLALIFAKYEEKTGESFSEALENEFSRHVEDATLAIVEVTRNLPRYFAKRLHDALLGRGPLGKDDSSLQRIIVSRAEIDLATIAREYYGLYGRQLVDDIEIRSVGDYEDALVALVGGHPETPSY